METSSNMDTVRLSLASIGALNLSDCRGFPTVSDALHEIYTRDINREDVADLYAKAIGRSNCWWEELQCLFSPRTIQRVTLEVQEDSMEDWELDATITLPYLPLLKDLNFRGVAVWFSPDSVPRLRGLTAGFTAIHTNWPHLLSFMDCLEQLPFLQELSLDDFFFFPPPRGDYSLPSKTLHNLTTLKLHYTPNYVHDIFSVVDLPSLRSMHVVSTFQHKTDRFRNPYQSIFPETWLFPFTLTKVEIVAKDRGFRLHATAEDGASIILELSVHHSLQHTTALDEMLQGAVADLGFLLSVAVAEISLDFPANTPTTESWGTMLIAFPALARLRVSNSPRQAPCTGNRLVAALLQPHGGGASCPSLQQLTLDGFSYPGGGYALDTALNPRVVNLGAAPIGSFTYNGVDLRS